MKNPMNTHSANAARLPPRWGERLKDAYATPRYAVPVGRDGLTRETLLARAGTGAALAVGGAVFGGLAPVGRAAPSDGDLSNALDAYAG